MTAPDWSLAACRDTTVDMFPTTAEGAAQAKAVCARCPIREDCLTWAVERGEQHGVWGGMTDSERPTAKQLRRQRQRRRPVQYVCQRDGCGTPLTSGQRASRTQFCSRECARYRDDTPKGRPDLVDFVRSRARPVDALEVATHAGMSRAGVRNALMRHVESGELVSWLDRVDGHSVRYFTAPTTRKESA